MTAPLPTPGEVEEMRERHVCVSGNGGHWCGVCADPASDYETFVIWPCDAARLLALVGNQVTTLDEDKLYVDDLDARLTAVLAECDRADADPLRPRQVHIDRIRRAATGEAT